MATSAERMRNLRARRAAGIEPAEGGRVRDAGELLGPAVAGTLAALKLDGRDAGAAALARLYAAVIDDARDEAAALKVFGPPLLRVLAALGATPASGHRPLPERSAPSWLDLQRESRARRRRP